MNSSYRTLLPLISVFLIVSWVLSCSGRPGRSIQKESLPSRGEDADQGRTAADLVKMVSPLPDASCRIYNPIKVALEPSGKEVPDSAGVWFDGKLSAVMKSAPWNHEINARLVTATGRKAVKVMAWKQGKKTQSITIYMDVLSDITPKRAGYKVVNTYPHDKDAFTQGLVYHGGFLYEGTGQETRSSLRKVDLLTGQVINQHNLDAKLFGEGIAVYDGRIYQLTWQSKVGFVYDLGTFRQINKFYYQTEGWGLTTMGNRLVMSDGTNSLYIIDPGMFVTEKRIEVCDDKGKVTELNELEYINGEIWANIWQTDLIARIDPESGRVLSYVDIRGIMNDPSFDTSVNVANGIAYDSERGRIFVTGKNWPRLFEIRVSE
ncbi:MAG TPA: glutaminyl-peptide cyclotransferase [Bacteroidales bacterium]|nr:glutaminyl-peptide cyclotransferase [Bacteroidales bacterium]